MRIWNVLLFHSFGWRIIQREKARSLDVFWPDGQSMAERSQRTKCQSTKSTKNNRENLLIGDNDFHYILFEAISINSVIFLNTCETYVVVFAFFLSDFWTSEDTPILRPLLGIKLIKFLSKTLIQDQQDVIDLIHKGPTASLGDFQNPCF